MVCLYLVTRNNRSFDEGGYFFFVISTTSAIMETIRVRSKNNSLYVIISTAPFQRGRKCPQNKEDKPPTVKVCLIPKIIIQ